MSAASGIHRELTLSARLKALADMVTAGSRVCDVGCDHGFLSIYLVLKQRCPQVLAMDVRSGPLSGAARHIAEYGLDRYIETRLSDGLQAMKAGEADTLVCAGMGGRLMQGILLREPAKAGAFRELILQPQSEIPLFRKFLRQEGYRTTGENILREDGKFYPMMKVVPTGVPIPCEDPLYDLFGGLLLRERHPVLKEFLIIRSRTVEELLEQLKSSEGERARKRVSELYAEYDSIRQALNLWGKA